MKLPQKLILMSAALFLAGAGPATNPGGTRLASARVDVWSQLDLHGQSMPGYVGGGNSRDSGDALDKVRASLCRNLAFDAKKMLGIDPDTLQEYITLRPVMAHDIREAMPTGQPGEPIRMDLELNIDDKAQPVAQEFLDKMIEELPHAINDVQRSPLQRQLEAMDLQVKQADADRQRNADLNRELRNLGIADRTPQGIQTLAHNLDEQRQQLTLETAALSAQLDALQNAVAKIVAAANSTADQDPVAKELQTIVDVKEKKLEVLRSMSKTGQVPASDAADAEASAAESRVQLLERREAVVRAAGGDALADFKKQTVVLEVTVAQDKAKLAAIEEQSSSVNQALELATQLRDGGHPQPDFDELANTKIREVQAALDEIPKAAVRVVSESAQ